MMKTKIQLNSCGFDSENLDDWLEGDLRQSGILPAKDDQNAQDNKDIKVEELDDWEIQHICDHGSDDKTVVTDFEVDKTKYRTADNAAPSSSSAARLAPIIRTFLTTLQQHQQQQPQPSVMIPPLLPFQASSTPSSPTLASTSSSSATPDSINPLHISKTPGIPSLNNTNAAAVTTTTTIAATTTTTTTATETTKAKRTREVDDQSDATNVMDPLVLKRLKNTHAARRSRQRKVMKMEGLQTRVAELEKRNEQLRSRVTMVEKERDGAKINEARLRDRVATLEAQLAEAHRSLIEKQEPLDIEKLY